MVEQAAVNRPVGGSSPPWGAKLEGMMSRDTKLKFIKRMSRKYVPSVMKEQVLPASPRDKYTKQNRISAKEEIQEIMQEALIDQEEYESGEK